MNRKTIELFLREISGLKAKGVLDDLAADKLRIYYEDELSRCKRPALTVLFSVLGGFLIASGLVLIFAKNWDFLPRNGKVVLAFLPLFAGQLLFVRKIIIGKPSKAWEEGLGAYLPMIFAGCLGLVGQIYHLPSDVQAFYFTCLLATLPLVYLLKSIAAAGLYFFFLIGWSTVCQKDGGHAFFFWPLFCAVIPFIKQSYAKKNSLSESILGWLICLTLSIGTGISLEKNLPGFWMVVYGGLFSTIYGAGLYLSREDTFLKNPYRIFGGGGLIGLLILLSQSWTWREAGWAFYRSGNGYIEAAGLMDYLIAAVFLVFSALFMRRKESIKNIPQKLFMLTPLLILLLYCLRSYVNESWPAILMLNIFLLGLSVSLMMEGIRAAHVGLVNLGLFVFIIQFANRFFDWDLGFLIRGVVFVLLGIGFISINLWMSKRKSSVSL